MNRRKFLQSTATLGTGLGLTLAAPPLIARAAAKELLVAEPVHSTGHLPMYIAMAKGYFDEAGIELTLSTANGGDKSMAALLSGSADIALIGPETAIYVLISDSPVKVRIFCGLTTTDGFLLVGREKVSKFEWSMLKGKDILGTKDSQKEIVYWQGPLLAPGDSKDLPPFETLARYETEIAENGAPKGVMKGTTAIAAGTFGKGRVLCFSPHPEKTDATHDLLKMALKWVNERAK